MTTTVHTPVDLAVAVKHFTKRYGAHAAVDAVSFDIPRGNVAGLIGPNGAGKTTVMKALLGLVAPTGGDLNVLGVPVGAPGWGTVLTRIGSIIEEPALYSRMTARQNLEYQSLAIRSRIDNEEIAELLTLVGLSDRADDKPAGFSLGMRQRLGIGIALIGSPELVILDEPANGLDPAGIAEIRDLVRRLPGRGCTVLVSSHQLAEVEAACDTVIVLAEGRVVTAGTTVEIIGSDAEAVFDIEVRSTEATSAISTLEGAGHRVVSQGSRLTVTPAGADVRGSDLARTLASVDVYPDLLAPRVNTLEDAFLNLTAQPGTTRKDNDDVCR